MSHHNCLENVILELQKETGKEKQKHQIMYILFLCCCKFRIGKLAGLVAERWTSVHNVTGSNPPQSLTHFILVITSQPYILK